MKKEIRQAIYDKYIAPTKEERPDFGTFTSASQVQLDVSYDQLTDVINVFGLLEPYKAILFANSYLPDYPEFLIKNGIPIESYIKQYAVI